MIQIEPATDAEFCPDGVAVTYHASQAGFPVRVEVDWDEMNCTLDITQISNLGTQPTVQDLIDALAAEGWTYAPAGGIEADRLTAGNQGTTTVNCVGSALTLAWASMGIQYEDESSTALPGSTTADC